MNFLPSRDIFLKELESLINKVPSGFTQIPEAIANPAFVPFPSTILCMWSFPATQAKGEK